MIRKIFRMRLVKDQRGFTLIEMMVTMLLMIVVLFALYSIFDMSIRIFSFGNDKVEATENARTGLERMEREVRAAYKTDVNNASSTVFNTWDPTQVAFGNETGVWNSGISAGETIRYSVNGNNELVRSQGGGTAEPVASFLAPNGLQLEYLKADGSAATAETQIKLVKVTLTVDKGRGDQALTTEIDVRNRQ